MVINPSFDTQLTQRHHLCRASCVVVHSWDAVPFESQFLLLADLRPLTQTTDGASLLEAETLRYAFKAWLREEGFYDVKVPCLCVNWLG